MNNIFSYDDLVFEISKHMLSTNFINFSRINKLCYSTINNLLNNIDGYDMLRLNNIIIFKSKYYKANNNY